MNDDPAPQSATPKGVPRTVNRNSELLEERAERMVYKTIEEVELEAYIFRADPAALKRGDARACILFFFGGQWDNGVVSQFATQCVYFAARGAVAIAFDYRVSSRHGTGPESSMADARSAIRWVRRNAEALGVDPEKIVAGGASAGAHIALSAAMLDGFDEPGEDPSKSAVPDALVLYSPPVDTSPKGFGFTQFADKKAAKKASPIANAKRGLPPMILFHGKSDRVVPYEGVAKFAKKLRWRRNRCELIGFDGEGHGFFNLNVSPRCYEATTVSADQFLTDLGFLAPSKEEDGAPRLSGLDS